MSRENSSRPLYSIYNIGLNTFCVVRDADLLLWLYRWAVELTDWWRWRPAIITNIITIIFFF
jgi:hypothetical protein